MNRFEDLEDELQKICAFSVFKVLKKPQKKTRFQKLVTANLFSCALIFKCTLIAFVYYYRNDLMSFLTELEFSLTCLTIFSVYIVFLKNRETLTEVLEWCKSRTALEDSDERRISYPFFKKALGDCELGVKIIKMSFFATFFLHSFGVEGCKVIFGEDKFPLPIPVFVFGIPATSLWSFLMNYWIEAFGIASNALSVALFNIWVLIGLRHVYASLEACLFAIRDMRNIVEDLSFGAWLKLVHGFLIDSTAHYNAIKDTASMVIYLEQKTMFTVLFVGWLTIKIDPSNLALTVGFLVLVVAIFVVCAVNEVFKQKYRDITLALYELPWYELKPKERRLLLPLMIAAQDHPVLRAGGLDEMTYENFLGYIKGAYSTAILMEELIYAN